MQVTENMAADLSEAKRLFQNESFVQCKDVLLTLYTKNQNNVRVLQKLGDVCIRLNQIEEAAKCYGILASLDIQTLDPSSAKSLFEFGRLLLDHNQLDEAVKFLERSFQIQESGAAHYYLGLIRDGRSDVDGALYHLQRACRIRPEVARYHFQLAKCLQSAVRYDDAKKSYEKALELSEHADAVILNEYSQFLYQCVNDRQLALDFAQLAGSLDERFSLKLKTDVTTNTGGMSDAKHSEDVITDGTPKDEHHINYSSLKCIIYDFDAAIQYLPLEHHVGSNLHNLTMMSIDDFLYIFGRRDRINRLRDHFEKLQSIKIRIGLYIPRNDAHYRDLVIAALERAYLLSYFEFVEDPYSIHGVAKRLHLEDDDELLLISNRGDYPCPKRFGVSLHDLECIERNLGFDIKMYSSFDCKIPPSFLSQRNFKLYRELRMQIVKHDYHDSKGLDSLDAIQWIKQNATESPFLELWMEFADKFLFSNYNSHLHRVWTALAVSDALLKIEPDDMEFRSQRAVFLQCLARYDEAESAFRDCLDHPKFVPHPRMFVDFGYFLFQQKRDEEAKDIFSKALKRNPVSIKANVGMGRTLDRSRRRKEAEYYFLKALAIDPNDTMAHIRYGAYLFFVLDDLEGALHHYKVAEQLRPDSDKTHHFLSRIYRELGDMKSAKECLIRCLSLNPSNDKSLMDYGHFFGDPDLLDLDQKSFILSQKRGRITRRKSRLYQNTDECEFCIFWVHYSEFFLRPDAAEFQKYYFEFKDKGICSITKLFDIDKQTLLETIGITNTEHMRLILHSIDEYAIRPYEDLKNWMMNVVGERNCAEELMNLLFKQAAVYSFDSFERNISSLSKLQSIFGGKLSIYAQLLWKAVTNCF